MASALPPPCLRWRCCGVALAFAAACLAAARSTPAATPEPNATAAFAPVLAAPALSFVIDLPPDLNALLRADATAAHLVLRSGAAPRVIVAFPAGDSGIGVWFAPLTLPAAAHWRLIGKPHPVLDHDLRGRALRGIAVELMLDVPAVCIERALLSSVRVLRDYQTRHFVPAQVLTPARITPQSIAWSRDRLDGAAGYRLTVQLLDGGTVSPAGVLSAAAGQTLHLRLSALTGETPLRPLGGLALMNARAAADPRAREVLGFLSYEEQYLAGSWRFDTYFGRDTLMSLTLLRPVLQPEALASGLRSVLRRLSPEGEVAHEEAIGEFAILLNEAAGRGRDATPVYDYGMIDEDFMLAPLAAEWLLDGLGGPRAQAFLAAGDAAGSTCGAALVRNLLWVVARTAPFAHQPTATHLIGLKPGQVAGDWRDSPDGLDGGRYPYDVNVALVPAALAAIDRLMRSGLLAPYLSDTQARSLQQSALQLGVWERAAPPLFIVRVPPARARAAVGDYAQTLGLLVQPPLDSLGGGALVFDALALAADGTPLPILHSDEGYRLLFETPPLPVLQRMLGTLLRPFPAGLMTPVGLLVADAAYAGPAAQRRFSNRSYHGAVVWSWQQALLIAGIDRQLGRHDLTPAVGALCQRALQTLWRAVAAVGALRSSELWSWSFEHGRYVPAPFDPPGGSDESDAVQLWSTVFLALRPPAGAAPQEPRR